MNITIPIECAEGHQYLLKLDMFSQRMKEIFEIDK
jgi:hypothetical protein